MDPQCFGRGPEDHTTRSIGLCGLLVAPTEVGEPIEESSRGVDQNQQRQAQDDEGPAYQAQPSGHPSQAGEGQRPGAGLDHGI